MKKLILTFSIVLLALSVFAQAPQKFNYQAIARNTSGVEMPNQAIGVRISIRDLTSSGTIVYQETHTVTTNAYGLFNLKVGNGTVTQGTFSAIAWGSGSKFIQTELDPTGGTNYSSGGTTELISVPYALYAGNAPAGPTGAQGPVGPSGLNGFNGQQGPTGAQGTQGIAGPTGATGANGANGATGAQGPTGAAGTNGTNGVTGATGSQGPTGANGTNGLNGATGATGPTGFQGIQGATGPQGATGSTGANGVTGPQGLQGPVGPTGANGTNGLNGVTGPQGLQGPTGANGTNGLNGVTGPQGPTGNNGLNGATGATGNNGADGITGPQGLQGPAGPTGANGNNGLNGATGATGNDGATGPQGPAGPTGNNGINGVTGAQGPTGPTGVGITGPTGPAGTTVAFKSTTVSANLPVNVATNMVFSNVTYNQGVTYNSGTGVFTCTEAGIYHFDGNVRASTSGMLDNDYAGYVSMFVLLNGAIKELSYDQVNAVTFYVTLQISVDMQLQVGDVVRLQARNNCGATVNVFDGYFNGHKLTSSVAGADGATGPQGPAGATGSQGIQGPTGANGTNGLNGATGATGNDGAQGIQGPTGPAGANGLNGATGNDGAVGPQGPAGPTGANGTNGLNGATGATGNDGAQGIQGPIGPTGTGVTGPTGPQGTAGTIGITGPTGPQGATGPANGPTGPTGADGVAGPAGPTGIAVEGPTIAFKAHATSTNVGSSEDKVIVFNNEDYDTDSGFNLSTSSFTCTSAGLYHFDVEMSATVTAPTDLVVRLHKTSPAFVSKLVNINDYGTVDISSDVQLAVGDIVTLRVLNLSESNITFNPAWFSGHKVTIGAQGPQGLQGPTGPAGGPTGPQGIQGPAGANGLNGATGATGNDGAQGPAGLAGATGATGNDGVAGAQGPTGPTGAGVTGPTGPQGIAGTIGITGPTGLQGATGPAGGSGTPIDFKASEAGFNTVAGSGVYTVSFSNIARNDGGGFNANGTFTAPEAGNYHFDATVRIGCLGTSTVSYTMANVASVQDVSGDKNNLNVSTDMYLSQGQTVNFTIQNTGSTGIFVTTRYISGHKVTNGVNGANGATGPQGPTGAIGPTGSSVAAAIRTKFKLYGPPYPPYFLFPGLTGEVELYYPFYTTGTEYMIGANINYDGFHCTADGVYHFDVSLPYQVSAASGYIKAQLLLNNNVAITESEILPDTANFSVINISTDLKLDSGDVVRCSFLNQSNQLISADWGTFSAHKIGGPEGPSGAQGTQGPAGPAGPQGPQGIPGPTGPLGGPTGPQGVTGPTGPSGGPQGPQGVTGPTGADGIQGPTGPTGVGITGPQGPQGATGLNGFTVTGPQGPQGIQGPIGQTGPTGAIGPTGPPNGPTGPTGATGPVASVYGSFYTSSAFTQTVAYGGYVDTHYNDVQPNGINHTYGSDLHDILYPGIYHISVNMMFATAGNYEFEMTKMDDQGIFWPIGHTLKTNTSVLSGEMIVNISSGGWVSLRNTSDTFSSAVVSSASITIMKIN